MSDWSRDKKYGSHPSISQGAAMMRAFLNKPNLKVTVPQQNSAEETFASIEAPPSPSHQSEPESAQSTSLTNASATEMQDFVVTND